MADIVFDRLGVWIFSGQMCGGLCGPRYRWEEPTDADVDAWEAGSVREKEDSFPGQYILNSVATVTYVGFRLDYGKG